jgi:N utilization substance protein B
VSARTKARKRALDVLFEADQRGANVQQVLRERLADSGAQTPLPEYSADIVRGVVAKWLELNAIIQDASTEWTMARMPAVDRALLRIAAWEILCNDDVATSVAIDEAVTLAADLSTDDSAKFVNGILATIARDAPAIGADATEVE